MVLIYLFDDHNVKLTKQMLAQAGWQVYQRWSPAVKDGFGVRARFERRCAGAQEYKSSLRRQLLMGSRARIDVVNTLLIC